MGYAAPLHETVDIARTCLEDLQAEVEAGARCAQRIYVNATSMDVRAAAYMTQAARFAALVECSSELKASISQQRSLLRELRQSLEKVRQSIRSTRDARAGRPPGPTDTPDGA